MNDTLSILANLITGENGSILIQILLFIPLLLTAQYLWINRNAYSSTDQKRLGIGLSALAGFQIVILLITAIFLPVSPQAQLFPAILERATTIAILITLFWLWMPAQKHRLGDALYGILLFLTFILFIYTIASQSQSNPISAYNATWYDFSWQIFSGLTTLCGIVIIAVLRPKRWGIMFLIGGVHLAAFILHITLNNTVGNFSAIVRLAQICTYPLIPGVFINSAQNSSTPELFHSSLPLVQAIESMDLPVPEAKLVPVIDYDILYLWTSILKEEKPEKILISVCRALAHTLKADLCYIISGDPKQKELLLQGGYDLIREVEKTGGSIQKKKLPRITKALENAENLQLTIEEAETADIQALRALLDLDTETNLLLLPMGKISTMNNAVLLLSPYSRRIWSKEEQGKVKPINQHINSLFENISHRTQIQLQNEQYADQIAELEIANQDWQNQNDEAHQEYLKASQEKEQLSQQLSISEEKMSQMVEKSQYEKISTRHQQTQTEIDRLKNNNDELKMQLDELKNAFFDVDQQEDKDNFPTFNGSSEVESMLAIQLESQEVISRLHLENVELQNELGLLSPRVDKDGQSEPVETSIQSQFELKKHRWLENIERIKVQEYQQKIASFSEQLNQMVDQVSSWEKIKDERKLRSQIEQWKIKADNIRKSLSSIPADEEQITFPQLLDEIFENLNEIVMQQDLTLRVDIPDGMNDIPIHEQMITNLLKTLLEDLVHSLQQDGWLSIRIEKQFTNLTIHISLGCSEAMQDVIIALLNKQEITNDSLKTHFGLILTKDLVKNMQGMIESTQNTMEQTNLHIRLPIT